MSASSNYRRRFTPEEDEKLLRVINTYKIKSWDKIAKYMPGRTGRQCRDRYNSALYMKAVAKPWTKEEDAIIVEQYNMIGPKWMKISNKLEGRTGNNVKNRWYKHIAIQSSLKKKLENKSPKIESPLTPPEQPKMDGNIGIDLVISGPSFPNEWDFIIGDPQIDQEFFNFMI